MVEQMKPDDGVEKNTNKKTRVTGKVTVMRIESRPLPGSEEAELQAEREEEEQMDKDLEVRRKAQKFLEGYVEDYGLEAVKVLWNSSIPGTPAEGYENVWFSVAMAGRIDSRWVIIQFVGTNNDAGRDAPKINEWLVPEAVVRFGLEESITIRSLENPGLCDRIVLADYVEDVEIAAARRRAEERKAERAEIATYFIPRNLDEQEEQRAVADLDEDLDSDI
ncbi:hypothetical protein HN748_03360 [Candidatus Peregrinibacteria bacterium]|jgi:hypothetical protein|nr:hypothetical protein [Candidatus Peregrinibacteria bacterium]MBT7484237.1 hypothetical protein [Candidatus Peregrinibacteria bacterium]MBT7703246.1 hypothetical protein [Candidatus Peregrinibacteria bacterium]